MPRSREVATTGQELLPRSQTGVVLPDAREVLPSGEMVHVYVGDTIKTAERENTRGTRRTRGEQDTDGERRSSRGFVRRMGRAGVGAAFGAAVIYTPVHFVMNGFEMRPDVITRDVSLENAFDVADGFSDIVGAVKSFPGVG